MTRRGRGGPFGTGRARELRAVAAAAGAAVVYSLALSPRSQVLGQFPWRGGGRGPTLALTFDDGPNDPWTSRIADTLRDRGIRATFFCVGRCVQRHPDVVRRVADQGHVIGNHSWSHRATRYVSDPSFATEIDRTQQIITDTIGRTPGLFRPPWLFRHPALLRTVHDRGLQVVSGEFAHPLEVLQPPTSWLADAAVRRTSPGSILIFHDGFDARGGFRGRTAAAIGPVVDRLGARGYRFVTVDEMLGVPAYLTDDPDTDARGRRNPLGGRLRGLPSDH